jgi:hypothetical protein
MIFADKLAGIHRPHMAEISLYPVWEICVKDYLCFAGKFAGGYAKGRHQVAWLPSRFERRTFN